MRDCHGGYTAIVAKVVLTASSNAYPKTQTSGDLLG